MKYSDYKMNKLGTISNEMGGEIECYIGDTSEEYGTSVFTKDRIINELPNEYKETVENLKRYLQKRMERASEKTKIVRLRHNSRWDSGYWEGRMSAYEDILDELEELEERLWKQ